MPAIRWILCILSIVTILQAQLPAHFEVASVRANHTAACQGRWDFRSSHGALTAENAPLLRIISRAYNLTDDRVSGPAWLDSQCYDIRAKASSTTVTDRGMMPMLQLLLRDRLHLVAHRESIERPVFTLVIDKDGSKLHPYGYPMTVPPVTHDGKILFMVRHLPDLCERLGKVTGRPVIDRTGLNGDYMIVLTYLPFVPTSSDPAASAADIFSAVREQLGLRLESQRGEVEILKVESVDKLPTEN